MLFFVFQLKIIFNLRVFLKVREKFFLTAKGTKSLGQITAFRYFLISKKNKEEREFLENKVAKLRDTKEQLESMIPSFKDWEKALAEFEKKDNELQDRIKQKQAKLKDKEVEESNKKAVKDENDLYKDTINKYKSLTKEIESLSKKQLDSFYKGDTTTFNKLESDIKGLYDKRDALDETIKKLKDYGKAQKEIVQVRKPE